MPRKDKLNNNDRGKMEQTLSAQAQRGMYIVLSWSVILSVSNQHHSSRRQQNLEQMASCVVKQPCMWFGISDYRIT